MVVHLLELHKTGRKSKLGALTREASIPFLVFGVKDAVSLIVLFFFMLFVLLAPRWLAEDDAFIPANPLLSPLHIAPE
jgi:ubiquinol-cytochrome c reductase cytochrome b subunit